MFSFGLSMKKVLQNAFKNDTVCKMFSTVVFVLFFVFRFLSNKWNMTKNLYQKRILSVSLIKVATALAIRTFLCCRWRYKFLLKKMTKWHNCRAVIYCFYICAFISIETEPIFFLKIPKTAELPGSVLLYLHFCVCITVYKAKELTLLMIPHFAAVAMYLSIQQFISAKIVILLYCKIM